MHSCIAKVGRLDSWALSMDSLEMVAVTWPESQTYIAQRNPQLKQSADVAGPQQHARLSTYPPAFPPILLAVGCFWMKTF